MKNTTDVSVLRERYSQGTRLQLEGMSGETQMPKGLKGVVDFVDDIGQIHVKWDNGSSLALNCDVDTFTVIQGGK